MAKQCVKITGTFAFINIRISSNFIQNMTIDLD